MTKRISGGRPRGCPAPRRFEILEDRRVPSATFNTFPLPAGFAPLSIIAAPDGDLWFAGETSLGRLSPGGTFEAVPVAAVPGPDTFLLDGALAADKDGDVWAAGEVIHYTMAFPVGIGGFPHNAPPIVTYTNEFLRVAPDGTVTPFVVGPDPANSALNVQSMATGPDGDVWFVARGQDSEFVPFVEVGRIAPDGTITEMYSHPIANGAPYLGTIAAGPDGNLWFTDVLYPNQGEMPVIARITPEGVVTDFTIPDPSAIAYGIAAGPDGNLWFAESGPDQFGRITPDGTITQFGMPDPNAEFGQPVAAPDGNIWFPLFSSQGQLARITPTGDTTAFDIPGSSLSTGVVYGLATGPDGNLWLTQRNPDQILQFVLSSASSGTGETGGGTGTGGGSSGGGSESVGPVAPVIVPLSGRLDPASDSGASDQDGITDVNQPRFEGVAAPGATVQLFAQAAGQAAPTLVGQAQADADGDWSLTTATLADGSYAILVVETTTAGQATGATLLPASQPLVIDTVAPEVVGMAVRPRLGEVLLAFRDDGSGLDQGRLLDPANYSVVRGIDPVRQRLRVTAVTAASPTTMATEVVAVHVGRIGPGLRYVIRAASGGVSDVAGNALAGTYARHFPTSKAGDFAARFATNGRRSWGPRPIPRPHAHPGAKG